MSRDLGELQKKILRCLEPDHVMGIMGIAAHTHGPTITRSEYECLRRAMHGLAKRGFIGKLWWGDGRHWATSATVDKCFEKFVEIMERMEVKRCKAAEPTLNPPDKRCISGQSNTYHDEILDAGQVAP